MATNPNFTATPKVSWSGNLTSSTNTYDGTSGTTLLLTAGSSGSYLKSIECEAAGTNVASNVRIFINNGSTSGTASNNALILQYGLPATTAATATPTPRLSIPVNLAIPASYTVRIVLTTTVASGWQFTAFYGDY